MTPPSPSQQAGHVAPGDLVRPTDYDEGVAEVVAIDSRYVYARWLDTGRWHDEGDVDRHLASWLAVIGKTGIQRPECICPPDYTHAHCPNCTPASSRKEKP